SVLCLPFIIGSVAIRAPYYTGDEKVEFVFVGDNVFPAIGVMAFAFMSTHTSFMNYLSLRDQSNKGWALTTTLAVSMSLTVSLTFAIIGYVSFGDKIGPNIFNNFPDDDG